jgi:hypothetical protein
VKLLIIGNSQAGALKRAWEARHNAAETTGIEMFFNVIPGGIGPDFQVVDGRLAVGSHGEKFPPYCTPPVTIDMSLNDFDAILISALGHFDGGFAYTNQITRAAVLADCGPRGEALKRAPVSDSCMGDLMAEMLELQPGIRTLRRVCAAYAGPIYVQRFPRISEAILEHANWGLRLWYEAPAKAHRILAELRDSAMEEIANDTGARLLDYPEFDHPRGFSPRAMMRDSDCIHQSDAYADLIIDQLCERLGIAT